VAGIAANLARIRAALPPGVTLVAVSKTHPPEAIREAHAAGQRDFGENYAQEWRAKAEALADLPDLRWHFIGGLQTNKVKYLAGRVAFVHTVDRPELAEEISRRWAKAGAVARVFLEVDLGGEARKAGCTPDEAGPLLERIRGLPALDVVGLTCIPPPADDPRPHFRALRALRDRLGLRELSMGMSDDWPVAVEEGATFVRIGTAIFGARAARGPAATPP
jgi:pyridoxal phosphate enzyme (YggS family)